MKIGMYKDDEILEFMTNGEGRGFMGRSMFDAIYFEIKELREENQQLKKQKDDVVEFIKNDLKLKNDFKICQDGAIDLLRMLGEIE